MGEIEQGLLTELVQQLKVTNRLLAIQVQGERSQMEMVALLANTGASSQQIAEILDTSAGTVRTTLSRLRRKGVLNDG